MERKTILSKQLIAGLDAARACAAIYVVLSHVADSHGFTHGAGMVFRFSQEAVIAFFLLSGFVIFANERERALQPRGYFLRRIRRIYPALLAAMFLSTLVAVANGDLAARFNWPELWGTLLALQDISFLKPGVIVNPYLGNLPLWTLSYEIAFYAVFPYVLMQWRRKPRLVNHIIGAACCGLYALFALMPNHFMLVGAYFLVWWSGAMAADAYLRGHRSITGMLTTFGWLCALCAVAALVVLTVGYHGLGFYPFLPLRHFAAAALMLILLFGPLGRRVCALAYRGRKGFAMVASISYGLYVLHYPLLIQWKVASSPHGFAFAVVLLLATAYLVEHLLPRLLPTPPKT
jgi:peptidoglycan/LPS O-acetylase OafA/YrhL